MVTRVTGVVLPDGHTRELLIEDGQIVAEATGPVQTRLDGGFVVPGLVDAHCHVGIGPDGPVDLDTAAAQMLADRDGGTTLIRDCGAPIDTTSLQQRHDLPELIRAGRHLARAKRYLRGVAVDVEDPSDLAQAVRVQAAAGDGWVKLVGDWIDRDTGDLAPLWPDDVLVEAIAAAHECGARVTAHVFGTQALPGLIQSGIDCIEHGTGLTEDLIAGMAERGTALVPTLINVENFPGIAAAAERFPTYAAHMRNLHAGAADTVRSAVEAGVSVYAGTDAGGGIDHGRIVDEILALHDAGMSATDALGAASWAARSWLGRPALEVGDPATFAVYPTDPRDDLEVLRTPTVIVLKGKVVVRNA